MQDITFWHTHIDSDGGNEILSRKPYTEVFSLVHQVQAQGYVL